MVKSYLFTLSSTTVFKMEPIRSGYQPPKHSVNRRQGPNKNMEQLQQCLTPGVSHTVAFSLSCSKSVHLDGFYMQVLCFCRGSGCFLQPNQLIKSQLWTRRLQPSPVPWGCHSPSHFAATQQDLCTQAPAQLPSTVLFVRLRALLSAQGWLELEQNNVLPRASEEVSSDPKNCRRHCERTWIHGGREQRKLLTLTREIPTKRQFLHRQQSDLQTLKGQGGTHEAGGVVVFHCLCVPEGFQNGIGLKQLPLQLPLKPHRQRNKQIYHRAPGLQGSRILPLLTTTSPGCGSATTSRGGFSSSPYLQICRVSSIQG